MAEKVIAAYGEVKESLGGDRFRVELENGHSVTAYPSGRLRVHHVRILPGDKVRLEFSPYDLTHGRITRRV